MWLLRFPLLRNTRYRADRNSAVDFLGRRLAGAAGDRDDPGARLGAARRARASCSAARRVVDLDHHARRPPAVRSRPRPRDQHAGRAPRASASATNACPSNRSPRIATNRSPGASVRESIDDAVRSRVAGSPRDQPARRGVGDVRRRSATSGCHRATTPAIRARRRASAARATSTSSNGSIAIADDLVLLVALAGDQHEVARPRLADRALDRRLAIDDRDERRRLRGACPPARSGRPAARCRA